MIIALVSILAVMAASALFGYAMHDVIQKGVQGLMDVSIESYEADHDRWEDDPVPTRDRFCDTCKHEISDPREWPCNECAPGVEDHWEAE